MENQPTKSGGTIPAVVSDALLDAFYEAAHKVIRLRNDTKGANLSRLDSYAHTALVALNCAIDELEAGGAKCPYNDGLGLPLSTERFFASSNNAGQTAAPNHSKHKP